MPVTDSIKKVIVNQIFCIKYLVDFQEKQLKVFFNSDNKVNDINFNYIRKLSFKIWKASIRVQKIDDFNLEIFGIIIANF